MGGREKCKKVAAIADVDGLGSEPFVEVLMGDGEGAWSRDWEVSRLRTLLYEED